MGRNSPGRIAQRYSRRYERSKGKEESKKTRRIRRYLEDGKISKKEAKKLRKRGITERDIERRHAKDFQRASEYNRRYGQQRRDRIPQRSPLEYSPYYLSRGAGRQFDKDLMKIKPKREKKRREPREREEPREFEEFNTMPEPDEGLQAFDPVVPTNLSLYQEPVTIGNPAKKKQQGGLNQFKSINPGLKISSKLLNI